MKNSRPAPRPTSASRVEMTELVIPEDTNIYGNVFGGRVMELIDKAAAIAALRHCRMGVVTASLDSLDFIHPIKLGHIITLLAQVNRAWGSSMEVGVKVFSEDAITEEQVHTCTAYLTMVAVGRGDQPTTPVPMVIADNEKDRQRASEADQRRVRRLERVAARHRQQKES